MLAIIRVLDYAHCRDERTQIHIAPQRHNVFIYIFFYYYYFCEKLARRKCLTHKTVYHDTMPSELRKNYNQIKINSQSEMHKTILTSGGRFKKTLFFIIHIIKIVEL